jgi:hypothetical protein
MKTPIVLIPLLAAGALAAQTSVAPANQTPSNVEKHEKAHRVGAVERLSKRLAGCGKTSRTG